MPIGGQPSPPVFEQIFKNARFAQGGNALFEGKVRGNPRPNISWTRQGRPIRASNKYQLKHNQQTGEVSLLINKIGPGDEGEYTCKGTNQYGEAVCTVYIQPEAAYLQQQQLVPQQQQQQQQQLLQQQGVRGQRMGGQQHSMQFRQETTTMTDASGHVTTSTKTDRQYNTVPFGSQDFRVDTFEYRLIRESEFRDSLTRRERGETDVVTETAVRRAGPTSAPQVQAKPRASKVLEGGDATFQARLVGNPTPKITWFCNGARVRPGPRAAVQHQDSLVTLTLRSVTQRDTGHYTMLAENAAGCVVSSAFLAVEPATPQHGAQQTAYQRADRSSVTQVEEVGEGKALAPSFLKVPSDMEVQEGKLVRLECRTAGKPAPEVFWYINGQPVANDATHKMLVNEAGNHALMITNASQRDAGVLTCVASNKSGETSHQVNLSVLEKEQVIAPKFVERFQTVHVRPGEAVSLSCRAVGAPTPRITWQKDGQTLSQSQSVRIITDGGASMIDIPCVQPEDSAWYQCTAHNAAGSTATRAKLYVDVGPAPPPSEPWRLQLPKPVKVIAPEAPHEPEIIHLKHVERSRPKPQRPEEAQPAQPPQFTHPLRDVRVAEGDRVLLEAKVAPLGDPTMLIEWYINGQPLSASSRATLTHKFGYVSLSLLTVIQQDTGVYTCRAVNQSGADDCSCTVEVGPRAAIETTPLHPDSLQQIQMLEDASRYQRTVSAQEEPQVAPRFVRELHDVLGVNEHGFAHFEAQVEPVTDSHMRVDWFKDGKPITASSRISNVNNFGHVALNISQLRAEDSGVYTVRATNKVGEAFSQAQLVVNVKADVTGDLGIPEQQQYIQSVEQLEAYKRTIQKQVTADLADTKTAPSFTQPIRDAPGVPENGTAHFEARLEPTGDSTLRVDWLKDGKPLEASSRMTTFFNFGYVSLTIKQVTIYDTGVYTCVASNVAGHAQCQATLQCVGKKDVITDSQVEGLEKFQYLEDSSRHQRLVEEDVTVTKTAPKFLGPLKGTNVIKEGQRAHFEARVEPQNDATMKTEWLHNGKPLAPASRIHTILDFGYVALDISSAKPEDAGTYTLVAKNHLGKAKNQAEMKVEPRQAIDTSSLHRGVVEKTDRMEKAKHVEPTYDIGDYCKSKPAFTVPLSDAAPQPEGRGVHLECRLEPLNDPTMKVEWFLNGRPITIGSRFRTYDEFGFVALDVLSLTAADAGEYTARATNQLGSAHTSAMVRVLSHADIDTDTQHETALDQIQYLEDSARQTRQTEVETTVNQVPTFTKPLRNVETMEGTNVHLECRLQPVGDNSMKVEWFVNDHPLPTGHRFRPAYEFDYVALDLLSVYPIDSGMYTCRATNRLGQAVTSAAIRVIAKKDLYTEHPSSIEQIQYIEDTSKYQRKEWADEMVQIKPKFVSQLKHQENLKEGQTAHFEAKVEPVTDVNLRVEWLKDGKPITVGHRHRPLHDFGYVALDILGTIPEDNGIYTCRATNVLGYDETSAILKSATPRKIVTDTQRDETGLQQLQYLEDKSKYSRAEVVDEVTTQSPVFTTSLANVAIKEGQRAHFESRLIPVSDHTMRVQWFHNGTPVKAGSRFVETNNFGFVALDIMHAYPEDQGTYTCKATNTLGEAVTQASLTCLSKSAIDQGTLHGQALDKLRHLEQKPQQARPQEESTTQAPVFTQPIKDVHATEGQPLHFEARLIPVGDAKLRVEWFKNGVPLQQANRISTMNDFGFVALDMKYSQEDDSGTYTCRATNELGQAATSATCVVQTKESLMLGSQHEGALPKLQQLEDKSFTRPEIQEAVVTEKPRFVTELTGPTQLVEGQSAHMEARIEPYPDTNMKVEWFFNGKPLASGHRFRTVNDFGFVSLDVLSAYPEDSGTYTVQATNKLGKATSQLNITVQPRSALIQESQHPAALQKISHLEATKPQKQPEQVTPYEKPVFGRPLKNANLVEGQPTHLEATLTPVNDANMKVEWFYNGRPIPQGHRFKTTYDFGFVALDLLYSYPEDSGTYMCKATNLVGEAVTTCSVNVEGNWGGQPVWRGVRDTVDSIEGRFGGDTAVASAPDDSAAPARLGSLGSSQADSQFRSGRIMSDRSDGVGEHARTEAFANQTNTAADGDVGALSPSSPAAFPVAGPGGVYYPFYNAECTYQETTKVPAEASTSEVKKTETSATCADSNFFTTTWNDAVPFPVPVAFNMRDLSLGQFKRMNEFFSGGSTINNPDYYDKKETKSAESDSKSWREGNTEYHTSTSKSESSSFTISKKTTVGGVPLNNLQSQTADMKSFTKSTENITKTETTRSERTSRSTQRHSVHSPPGRSVSSERPARYRSDSASIEKSHHQRAQSVGGGTVVPVEADYRTWPRTEPRPSQARGADESHASPASQSVKSLSSLFSEEKTSRSESASRPHSCSSLSCDSWQAEPHEAASKTPTMEWPSRPGSKTEERFQSLLERSDRETSQTTAAPGPQRHVPQPDLQVAESSSSSAQKSVVQQQRQHTLAGEPVPPPAGTSVTKETRMESTFSSKTTTETTTLSPAPTVEPAALPAPVQGYEQHVKQEDSRSEVSHTFDKKSGGIPIPAAKPKVSPVPYPGKVSGYTTGKLESSSTHAMKSTVQSTVPLPKPTPVAAPLPAMTSSKSSAIDSFLKEVSKTTKETSAPARVICKPRPQPLPTNMLQKFSRHDRIDKTEIKSRTTEDAAPLPTTQYWDEQRRKSIQTVRELKMPVKQQGPKPFVCPTRAMPVDQSRKLETSQKATTFDAAKRIYKPMQFQPLEPTATKAPPVSRAPEPVHPVEVQKPELDYVCQSPYRSTEKLTSDALTKTVTEQRKITEVQTAPAPVHKAPIAVPKPAQYPQEMPQTADTHTEHGYESTTVTTTTQEQALPPAPPPVTNVISEIIKDFSRKEEISDVVSYPVSPAPQAAESREFQSETRKEMKTTVTEQEDMKPVPQPVWVEPVQTPLFSQSEHQKRMEEKFLRTITETKEDREVTQPESIPQAAPAPVPLSAPQEQDVHQSSRSQWESFVDKNVKETVTEHRTEPIIQLAPSPAPAHVYEPIGSVESPAPAPREDVRKTWDESAVRSERTQQWSAKPAEHRQAPQPAATVDVKQSQTQKRLEEKFFRRMQQQQSQEDVAPSPEPSPGPTPPLRRKTETHEKKQEEKRTTESARKLSVASLTQSDMSDSDVSVKIREIETKPLQTQSFESYTSKTFIGPKVQEPPIYHQITLEGEETKKVENVYETIIPYPKPFQRGTAPPPAEPRPEERPAPSPADSAFKHVESPKLLRKQQPKPATPFPFQAVPDQAAAQPTRTEPKPRAGFPDRPLPDIPETPKPVQHHYEAIKRVQMARNVFEAPKPVRLTAPVRAARPLSPAPMGTFRPIPQAPVMSRTRPQRAELRPVVPAPPPAVHTAAAVHESVVKREDKQTCVTQQVPAQPAPVVAAPKPYRAPAPAERDTTASEVVERRTTETTTVTRQIPPPTQQPAPVRPPAAPKQASRTADVQATSSLKYEVTSQTSTATPQPAAKPTSPMARRTTEHTTCDELQRSDITRRTRIERPAAGRQLDRPVVLQPQSAVPTARPGPEVTSSTTDFQQRTVSSSSDVRTAPLRRHGPEMTKLQPVCQSPYGDKQETLSQSRTLETTDTGRREVETTEKRSQAFEQSVSHTPTVSSTTTSEEKTFQTMSQSHETSEMRQPAVPPPSPYALRQVQVPLRKMPPPTSLPETKSETVQETLFQTTAKSSEMTHQSTPQAPSPVAPSQVPRMQAAPFNSQERIESLKQKLLQTQSTSESTQPYLVCQPVQPPQPIQPYVDKRETFSHEKESQITETGHKESETTDKKSQAFEQSATHTPAMTSSKTVEETSSQTMTKTFETSQQSSPRASVPVPVTPAYLPPVEIPPPMLRTEEKIETSEKHFQTQSDTQKVATPQFVPKSPPGIYRPVETPRTLPKPLPPQPQTGSYVDKQETFSQSKTSEKTGTGHIDSETAEKRSEAVEKWASDTPAMSSSKTVEEKSFQTISKSFETSQQSFPQSLAPVPIVPVYKAPVKEAPQQTSTVHDKTESSAQRLFQTSESRKLVAPEIVPKPVPAAVYRPVEAPRPLPKPQPVTEPYVDKQETFSHTKTSEKTATGHSESDTTQKRSQAVEKSVSHTPTMVSSKTVEEKTFQSISESHDTAQRSFPDVAGPVRYPLPKSDVPYKMAPEPRPISQSATKTTEEKTVNLYETSHKAVSQDQLPASTSPVYEAPVMAPQSTINAEEKKETIEKKFYQAHLESQNIIPAAAPPKIAPQPAYRPVLAPQPQQKPMPPAAPIYEEETKATEQKSFQALSKMYEDFQTPAPQVPATVPTVRTEVTPVEAPRAPPKPGPQFQPYVDKQETFSQSRTSEKTETGRREAETAEKKSQSTHQSFSRTPAVTTSKSVEENTFQTMSQSQETSREVIPQAPASTAYPFVPTEMPHPKPGPLQQSKTEHTEQTRLKTMSKAFESTSKPKPLRSTPLYDAPALIRPQERTESQMKQLIDTTSARVQAPQTLAKPGPRVQPYVDKQETFNQSKTCEKTETGYRESEMAEKKAHAFEQSVSETPTMTSSKTVEEKTFQTISQSHETSQDMLPHAPAVATYPSLQAELPLKEVVRPGALPQSKTETMAEKSFQTMSKSHEMSRTSTPQRPVPLAPAYAPPVAPAYAPPVEAPRPLPTPLLHTGPHVDKQETFSQSKIFEKTDTGHRESETAEKKSQAVEHSVSHTPTMTSSKTVEEQSFQTMSQSHEVSTPVVPRFQPFVESPSFAIDKPLVESPQSFRVPQSTVEASESSSLFEQLKKESSEHFTERGTIIPIRQSDSSSFMDRTDVNRQTYSKQMTSSGTVPQTKIIPVQLTSETLKKEMHEKHEMTSLTSQDRSMLPMLTFPQAEQSMLTTNQEHVRNEQSSFSRQEDRAARDFVYEQVIPVQPAVVEHSQSVHSQQSEKTRVERQTTHNGQEHVIPVQLSPFSERPFVSRENIVKTDQLWSSQLDRSLASMELAAPALAALPMPPGAGGVAERQQVESSSLFSRMESTAAAGQTHFVPVAVSPPAGQSTSTRSSHQETSSSQSSRTSSCVGRPEVIGGGGGGAVGWSVGTAPHTVRRLQATSDDGGRQHLQSMSHTSGSECEEVEEINRSRRSAREAEEATKTDRQTEHSEREEVRPDGKYLIQRTVETTTEEELKRNQSSETIREVFPAAQ